MSASIDSLIQGWDGLGVVARHDQPTGAWIFIALHSSTLGQPSGGTRMTVYGAPADGLRDAMRLAEGMTSKWAAINFDFGGGKAVLALSHPLSGEERAGLLRRYGGLLESLNGSFATGVDLGTTSQDMKLLGQVTRWVHGMDEQGRVLDPSPYTAWGVYLGLRTALRRVFGVPSPAGRTVLVQGLGNVGGHLARYLAQDGARLVVSDLNRERLAGAARDLDARAVPVDEVYETSCDAFAPCAVGAILNQETIPRLRCRIVAGSANNQLAQPEPDAAALHRRGILYAPDYLINAGGAMTLGSLSRGLRDPERLRGNLSRIAEALGEIFEEAALQEESPVASARRRVERVLARGQGEMVGARAS